MGKQKKPHFFEMGGKNRLFLLADMSKAESRWHESTWIFVFRRILCNVLTELTQICIAELTQICIVIGHWIL